MNAYKCHICNVDMPKTYMEEHISGAKHKTCLKIANIALERVQLHMKSNLIPPRRKIEVTDTYFCNHCTTVVQNIEKEKHIMTNKHVNSVNNDDLLQKLLKIYEEPNKDYDFANISAKDIEVHNLIDELAISKDKIGADNTNNDTTIKEDKEKGTNDPKTEVNTKMSVNQQQPQINKDSNKKIRKVIDDYYQQQPQIHNDCNKNIGKVINANVIAKAKNKMNKKSEVKVDVKNDNQEKKKDKQNTTSDEQTESNQQPCGSTSKIEKEACAKENTSNYKEELQDLKHYLEIASFLHMGTINVAAHSEDVVVISGPKAEKVKVPLVNFHGFSVTGENVVCKICLDTNSVDGKKHKWSDSHMKKVMSPLKEGHFRQGDILDHCILCNRLYHTSQIADHIASVEHVNNLQKYAVLKPISKKVAQLAVTNYMKWTHDKMFCKICEIQVEKMDNSILEHTQSEEHTGKYAFVLMVNKITNVPSKNGSCLCLVCQKEIWAGHLLAHKQISAAQKKIGQVCGLGKPNSQKVVLHDFMPLASILSYH